MVFPKLTYKINFIKETVTLYLQGGGGWRKREGSH